MSAQSKTKDSLSAYEQRRQKWIGIFAKTSRETLEECAEKLLVTNQFHTLRAPERGLVMVRARAGGTGTLFNTGEMTVTRCSVRSESGKVGHGYVAGRNQHHAELAAKLDAVMQELPAEQADTIVRDLDRSLIDAATRRQQKSAPTRVDFYTMVRGDAE